MGERKAAKPYRVSSKNLSVLNAIKKDGKDILKSPNFRNASEHVQHGSMSVRKHSISVARQSLVISKALAKIGIKTNRHELIRGALLHDYFLYDWHDKEHLNITNLHGFYHPGIALKNASKEFLLSPREKDIIKKHMWPLTIMPPLCREAWIVTAADKYCSILETIGIHRGRRREKKEKKV